MPALSRRHNSDLIGARGRQASQPFAVRPGQPDCKKSYVGPMPIDIPDFAIHNAGWLCRDYYLQGYKQGRRDEGRFRRKKRPRYR